MKLIKWILVLNSFSCFGQSVLEDTEFYDGQVFISSETYGWSWTYKFGKDDYKLYLYYRDESPKEYLFEEGSYSHANNKVVLVPRTKLICEIGGHARFDCMTAIGPEHGFLVSRDSLSVKEITELAFTERVCSLLKEADTLKFKDPSIEFKEFSQRKIK